MGKAFETCLEGGDSFFMSYGCKPAIFFQIFALFCVLAVGNDDNLTEKIN